MSFVVNPHLGKAGSSKTASATGKRKKTPTSQQMSASYQALPYQKNETHFVAQLLISSLHSWDLDPNMDDVCVNRLGLLKPVKPVSFGLVTRGNRFSLMLPGWYGEVCRINNEDAETTLRKLSDNEDLLIEIEDTESDAKRHPSVERGISALRTCFQSRWQLSSALTTLHLVGLVSVANTLMSLNQISFVPKEKRLALLTTAALEAPSSSSSYDENDKPPGMSEVDVQRAMNHRAHIKAGWSQLAALHCCLLADILKVSSFKPPLLHILARKWQDRCLEVWIAILVSFLH